MRTLFNPLAVPAKMDSAMEARAFEKYTERLASAITHPDAQKKLRQLRVLTINDKAFTPAAVAFYADLMGGASQGGARMIMGAPMRSDADYIAYIRENYGDE